MEVKFNAEGNSLLFEVKDIPQSVIEQCEPAEICAALAGVLLMHRGGETFRVKELFAWFAKFEPSTFRSDHMHAKMGEA